MASEEGTRQLKKSIIQCLTEKEHSLAMFRSTIVGKDVEVFLGNTKSGKSTLVNYIIGNHLRACLSGKKEFKIRINEDEHGPDIGQESTSCTTIPGVYTIPNTNTVAVDLPGFEDNRGVVQDILNALCISQIKVARTVKFVMVFDINEILCDNIRNFTNSLSYLQHLLNNFDVLKNSICAIFTKDWKEYDDAELADVLKAKILDQDKLAMDKILVRNFCENKKLIGVFRMPTKEGPVTENLDVNVKGAIEACRKVDVEKCEVKFAFSDKAQEALLEIYPEYTDSNFFKAETTRITVNHDNYFTIDKYVFASYDNELEDTKRSLQTLMNTLNEQEQVPYNSLWQIQACLDNMLEPPPDAVFRTNFRFVTMLDDSGLLKDDYKEMIRDNFLTDLREVNSKVVELITKIDDELDERRRENIVFITGGVSAAAGAVPAYAGLAKVVESVFKTGDAVKKLTGPGVAAFGATEGAIGGFATTGLCLVGAAAVGAGAGASYMLYKQTVGKRKEARQQQGRTV